MKTQRLTDSQRAMLLSIAAWGDPDDGWCEVELQWSCRRDVPDYLVAATAERCVAALRRKGLVTDAGGPEMTEAGRALVQAEGSKWKNDGSVAA